MKWERKNRPAGHEKKKCPFCGKTGGKKIESVLDADRLSPQAFQLICCRRCLATRTEPNLDDAEMAPWYREQYHGRIRLEKFWYGFDLPNRWLQLRRAKRIPPCHENGTVLDIGCGNGSFLKFMAQRGWQGIGIENSEHFARRSMAAGAGLKIFGPATADWEQKIPPVDVVTMWHVLEHVQAPWDTLQKAKSVLKPKGSLIVCVPNIDSKQANAAGKGWFHLDVPRHRWHFTPKSLVALLNQAGFEAVRIFHFSMEYNPYGWWQSLLNMAGCTHNFVYNLLKRGETAVTKRSFQTLCDIFIPLIFGFPVAVSAFALSLEEALEQRGGTLTVVARRRTRI